MNKLDSVYSTIIHWDIGGGKRSRRELARRIVALYAKHRGAEEQKEISNQSTYGWLIACDDALITTHLGVAELSHSYDYAKNKLNELIDWHISVATEPSLGATLVRKPLTDQQIYNLASTATGENGFSEVAFARAIEAAHNIRN